MANNRRLRAAEFHGGTPPRVSTDMFYIHTIVMSMRVTIIIIPNKFVKFISLLLHYARLRAPLLHATRSLRYGRQQPSPPELPSFFFLPSCFTGVINVVVSFGGGEEADGLLLSLAL